MLYNADLYLFHRTVSIKNEQLRRVRSPEILWIKRTELREWKGRPSENRYEQKSKNLRKKRCRRKSTSLIETLHHPQLKTQTLIKTIVVQLFLRNTPSRKLVVVASGTYHPGLTHSECWASALDAFESREPFC